MLERILEPAVDALDEVARCLLVPARWTGLGEPSTASRRGSATPPAMSTLDTTIALFAPSFTACVERRHAKRVG
jgi:hypothetical protein